MNRQFALPTENPSLAETEKSGTIAKEFYPFGSTVQARNPRLGSGAIIKQTKSTSAVSQVKSNTNTTSSQSGELWYYLDHSNHVMGPYTMESMHSWYMRGYITSSVFVSTSDSLSSFRPVSDFFSPPSKSFLSDGRINSLFSSDSGADTLKNIPVSTTLFSLSSTTDDDLKLDNWEKAELSLLV